jgi:tetratricopeptide (TPR) repeat protein
MVNVERGALAAFADGLRELRRSAGEPGYRVLARKAGYGPTTLWEAARGRVVPTLAVTLAYVRACGGDVAEWERRWHELSETLPAGRAPDVPGKKSPVPRQLPLDVSDFTGRSDELARLDSLLAETERSPAVVISAVSGTAGVGKTALAVRWAHAVADRFPDGHLYVDLRGYDPDQPIQPADALAGALRALGVEGGEIPGDVAERAARYRTLLAQRRMLIVLDNAYGVEQVRPLLPGGSGCFVVVTSRDSLSGLVARHGARRLDLDLLSEADGMVLLRRLVGDRINTEPAAAATIIRHCARLPLALRIAAELLAARPLATIANLAAELADERARLDLLDVAADARTAVRAVFSWSYQRLPAPAAAMFRLLGLSPARDVDGYAAAALAGVDFDSTRRLLDVLVRANLVQMVTQDRHSMHDLLRTYAGELAAHGNEPDRRAALTRMIQYYLSTASAAMNALFPAEQHRRPRISRVSPAPPVATAEEARDWLDTELPNLVAVTACAATQGWPTYAGYFSATLWRYLEVGAHYDEATAIHRHAMQAAAEHGDTFAVASAQMGLGSVCLQSGRYEEGVDHYQRAAALFAADGDRMGETRALVNLGAMYAQLGRYDETLSHYRRAIDGYRELGDHLGEATTLGWIGLELGRLGRYDEAVDDLRQALTVFREIDFPMREAEALNDLGQVLLWAGRHDEALDAIREALAIGNRTDSRVRDDASNSLAEILQAMGRADEALTHFRSAVELAREHAHHDQEARALAGIAATLAGHGDLDQARGYWREALELYVSLNMPQAEEVRARLMEASADEALADG